MIKWLIKSTNEFRLESMEDVEKFHKELQQEAAANGYTLSTFSWKEVEKKSKGEVIESWFIVKYTFVFNDSKAPENLFTHIEYTENVLSNE